MHFIAIRALSVPGKLLGASLLLFAVLRPTDPDVGLGGGSLAGDFMAWMARVAFGNFGWSAGRHRTVSGLIGEALPATLQLVAAALAIAVAVGVIGGAAWFAGRKTRAARAVDVGSVLWRSVPVFAFALVLGSIFPILALGLAFAPEMMRAVRFALDDACAAPSIRQARLNGVADWEIFARRAPRLALEPVLAAMGARFGALLAGSLAVEAISARPGLGATMIDAMRYQDPPVIFAVGLIYCVLALVGDFAFDAARALLDPRIRA